jgi:hypothetical protein
VYQGGGHLLDLFHQVGLPVAVLLVLTAPLALIVPALGIPALLGLGLVAALGAIDVARANAPRGLRRGRWRFRLGVAAHHLLQPLVRSWGRYRSRHLARRDTLTHAPLPAPVSTLGGGVVVLPQDRDRADVAAAVIGGLRREGARVLPPSGWEDFDARLAASPFVVADVQTSGYPEGFVQVRMRTRMRWGRLAAAVAAAVALGVVHPAMGAIFAGATLAETGRELVRAQLLLRRAIGGSGGTHLESERGPADGSEP